MTYIPEILPSSRGPRTVLFVAYPGVGLLDLTGPQTVFWAATKAREKRGLPGYTRHIASLDGGLMQTAEGAAIDSVRLDQFALEEIDTIVMPGSPHITDVLERSASLIAWLQLASARVRRTAAVCSGTFLLAQAQLLEGKRAATHWAMCDMLGERFPAIEIDRDAIFVQQDNVWTSAGVSAGIDLALALVEADCGRDVAMEAARELVVFLKRPGGQAQFSELLQSQSGGGSSFDELHAWIADNLGNPGDNALTVEALARRVCMSPRNFARVYKQETGRTPAKAVEIFRLEASRRLLEESDHNLDRIAVLCGFGDEERMRVTFHRHLGVAPRDYRKRFAR